jgi:hypothetical protein
MKNTYKRYLVSSLITFLTAFMIAIVPLMETLTPENFGKSAIFGIIVAGVRAGIKALSEWLIKNINI